MREPQNHLAAYDFTLPERLIAQAPADTRDGARLLHVARHQLYHRHIADLPGLLRAGDALVLNDSRVIPARLFGLRGAARIELLLHRQHAPGLWDAFARPAKRLKIGDRISITDDFHAILLAHKGDGLVEVSLSDASPAALEQHGHVPLPPYIRRSQTQAQDRERYQTVYARQAGSVAAPTAGLHFTPELLAAIEGAGVHIVYVTLHVGAGTFLPVKSDDIARHVMHAEQARLDDDAAERINAARAAGGRVVAVGTTAARLLETAADDGGRLKAWHGDTALFITPGYRFKCVDCLLTNFHLPKSTLFMLTAAFAGLARMQEAYREAIAREYRFYSYGDACFLERAENP